MAKKINNTNRKTTKTKRTINVSRGCGFEREINFTIQEIEAYGKKLEEAREPDGEIMWA